MDIITHSGKKARYTPGKSSSPGRILNSTGGRAEIEVDKCTRVAYNDSTTAEVAEVISTVSVGQLPNPGKGLPPKVLS